MRRTVQHAIKAVIRAYQILISSWLPPTCRFYPSCSQYMLQAVERYGPVRGTWMGLRRLARCHPWNDGGYDPLPEG
ncbi:MAG: membrane protein insertion efficiency factor YidD [Actinobacteria bacterium]|jgi:putative membrane protein insertion efficiency factor|nr:MAG: membrane protein insertion efficiency factor YidD [Actinomycetota bacterium]